MSQEPITLFLGVEILPNIDKRHAIDYLKGYCTIDDLGNTIHGKFIITSKNKKIFLDSKFNNYTIKGDYPICGNFPELLITTNLTLEELN